MSWIFQTLHRERMKVPGGVAILAALSIVAMPVRALTIEEALAEAVRTNPTLRAAREGARAGHESVPSALSAWLPTIGGRTSASFTQTQSTPNSQGPPPATRITDRESIGLSYTQNLFNSGGDVARFRQAGEGVLASHAEVEGAEWRVLLNVATAYLNVIRAGRTVGLREASLAAFKERAREANAQFRVGDRTQADVAQTDAEQAVGAAEVVSARADLETQRAEFEALVGMAPDDLEAADEPAGLPQTLAEARHTALNAQPAVRAAEHAVRAAEHAVSAAAAALGPSVDLSGGITRDVGHGHHDSGGENSSTTDMTVGIRLTLPFYQAGLAGAQLRQAQHSRAQRRQQLLAAKREALRQATSVWQNLNAARQRHAALTAAVKASNIALTGIRREAAIGERTTREVLDAERNLVTRQVNELDAERDSVVRAYELLAVVGALTARGLGIADAPDLDREAGDARWNLGPGILSIGRD